MRQRSHDLPPLENACPLALIDHLTLYGVPLSFNFQMYDDKVVCLVGLFLKDLSCSPYLDLNDLSVDPKYLITLFSASTSAW